MQPTLNQRNIHMMSTAVASALTVVLAFALVGTASRAMAEKSVMNPVTRDGLVLQIVQEAIERSYEVSAPQNVCSLKAMNVRDVEDFTRVRETAEFKDLNGSVMRFSVLEANEIGEIHSYLSSQEHIPFGFSEDGCWERALEMTRILRNRGVTAAIYSMDADFPPGEGFDLGLPQTARGVLWKFHAAVAVAVREGGTTKLVIIDPSVSKEPMTESAWKKRLLDRMTIDIPTFSGIMPRSDRYDDATLERANARLRVYREAQRKREALFK